jgi:tRNA(Ile)-lysidine synthase
LPELLGEVRNTIERCELLAYGDGVVIGVSGGPDSLCLLHLLRRLQHKYNLQLHVAHLHHGARGAAADGDARFVADLADQWGLPCTVEQRDVPGIAAASRAAFEETARRVRYAFLASVASEVGATRIAVGHTADDQAETVLMHLLRGSGLAGLRGMLPSAPLGHYRLLEGIPPAAARSIQLIRPLLRVSRRDVELYCAEQGLAPRFDRSNLDTTYFRNRLRHKLLPTLETYNPRIRQRLCHTAQVLASEYDLLARMRTEAWERVVAAECETYISFDRAAWRDLPVALQRATIRRAAYQLRQSLRDVGFVHVEKAREAALEGDTGTEATLPQGLALTVGYETLTLADRGDIGPPPDEPLLWSQEPVGVEIPGTTVLPDSGWQLRSERLDNWDLEEIPGGGRWQAVLDEDRLPPTLALRPRRRGDRFQPLGMDGHGMRLSALMINLKIPAAWRDQIPLLAGDDQIVWVCGRRLAHGFEVTPETSHAVRVTFERIR